LSGSPSSTRENIEAGSEAAIVTSQNVSV
jgi:hypothetical protein